VPLMGEFRFEPIWLNANAPEGECVVCTENLIRV